MNTSSSCNKGWDQFHAWGGPHGRHHFSPLKLIVGLFVFFTLLKTGLIFPLIGLGVLAFFLMGVMGGPRQWQRWQSDFEGGKPKRGHGPMHRPWYGDATPNAEKPKRDYSEDEFV